MRLRVGLELTGLELDAGGTARAARGLAAALAARDDVALVTLRQGGRVRGRVSRGLVRELAWLPLALPRRAARAGLDVLHCPGPAVPVRPGSVPLVVTVHDALPWAHPEWMGRANVLQHRLVLERALPRAAHVLVPSAFTRDELLGRFPLDRRRVTVTPWGVDPLFTPGPSGEPPLVVTVGTLQPRKDLETALAAWERSGIRHRLVVIGARGWGDAVPVDRFGGRVQWRGRVSDAELVGALRAADALLLPSRYEGFGLPALEAMACGTPVLAAAAAALPEVVGDAGVLLPPGDVAAWAEALAAVTGDGGRRNELRERGIARARSFTWTRCAQLTVDAYRAAASGDVAAPRTPRRSRR